MSDKTDEKKAEAEKAKAEKPAAKSTITLMHDGVPGDLLSIGDVHYSVVDWRVEIAPEHLEAALMAGFRRL